MRLKSAFVLALVGMVGQVACAAVARDDFKGNLEQAFGALQQWYSTSLGLWIPSTGWWNSANCLTMLVGAADVDYALKPRIINVIAETFVKAPFYSPPMMKVVGADRGEPFLMHTYYTNQWPYLPETTIEQYGKPQPKRFKNFINDYYDDEGWWALGWIAAYDLTRNPRYLQQAEIIFADMNAVFGKTNCSRNVGGVGGIWWDRKQTYVNAIANELFFSTAASLANRARGETLYLDIAKKQWAWFVGTGMITGNSTINDGLDQKTCRNNGGTIWTYNQGVILGGLVEFSKATNDSSYIKTAHEIATAAIATLAPSGILRDPCEPANCGADGSQFKGIFVRNLQNLHKVSPRGEYRELFRRNARSIWENGRTQRNELSLSWAGPVIPAFPANASTQSSAMDCLVAAVAVS